MFARMLEFKFKFEKREELINKVQHEILPILKKQPGFFDVLGFYPEMEPTKLVAISLWHTKKDAERYEREFFAKVKELVEPYVVAPITPIFYTVEPKFSETITAALAA
jgi:hypothetical protein